MAQHALLSKNLNLCTYFADPHSPWQRGSNENINGLIRQFLPKGEDLSGYSQTDLNHIAWLLNGRPRKRFGFRTPLDMMETELEGGLMRLTGVGVKLKSLLQWVCFLFTPTYWSSYLIRHHSTASNRFNLLLKSIITKRHTFHSSLFDILN